MTLLLCLVIFIAMIVSIKLIASSVQRYGTAKNVSLYRIKYISKTVSIVCVSFYLALMANIAGFEYSQISIFLSSVFAVLGVAMFAQWSILSNITASLIIFFGFPYRVGDKIKILDKDDDISGVIEEISLFHVLIKRGDETITYPNTLILQKGVIKKSLPSEEVEHHSAEP